MWEKILVLSALNFFSWFVLFWFSFVGLLNTAWKLHGVRHQTSGGGHSKVVLLSGQLLLFCEYVCTSGGGLPLCAGGPLTLLMNHVKEVGAGCTHKLA